MPGRNLNRLAFSDNPPDSDAVWRDLCSCEIACHIDTIGMQFKHGYLPVAKINAIMREEGKVHPFQWYDEEGDPDGGQIEINQPVLGLLPLLRKFERNDGAKLYAVHFAFEFAPRDMNAAEEWLVTNTLLNKRRKGPMKGFSGGIYWASENHLGYEPSRDMLLYPREGKLLTDRTVLRLEPRLQTAEAVRRAGIRSVPSRNNQEAARWIGIRSVLDLPGLVPSEVLARLVTFVDGSFRDALEVEIVGQQREAVYAAKKKARVERRLPDRNGKPFYSLRDRYRGNLHHYIRHAIERGTLGRAQLALTNFKIPVSRLDMGSLPLPEAFTWER